MSKKARARSPRKYRTSVDEAGFLAADAFDLTRRLIAEGRSFEVVIMVVLGGMGSLWGAVAGAVLCSVVPAANRDWLGTLRRLYGVRALVVSHRTRLPVRTDYPRPATRVRGRTQA